MNEGELIQLLTEHPRAKAMWQEAYAKGAGHERARIADYLRNCIALRLSVQQMISAIEKGAHW